MKLFILTLLVLAVASSTEIPEQKSFIESFSYKEFINNQKNDECQDVVDKMATNITKIIYQFIDGFDFWTFMREVAVVVEGGFEMADVCQGEMWEAVIDLVLSTLEDGLQGCGKSVVLCIEDAADFIDMFVHDHHPPAIIITRKLLKLANDIVDTVEVCQNSTIPVEFSEQLINQCVSSVERQLPQLVNSFQSGISNNMMNLMIQVGDLKMNCFDPISSQVQNLYN